MDCKKVEHIIVDFIDEQLSNEVTQEVENHIASCGTCQIIHDETLVLMRDLENEEEHIPNKNVRTNFYAFLEEEKQLQSKNVIPLNQSSGFVWKRAFQIAASFLLLFLGYFMGSYNIKQSSNQEIAILKKETLEMKENMLLAMIDNRSASKRIKAVNFTEDFVQPDEKILNALLDRMQFDSNINVRLAAAEALSRFSEFEQVKIAFIDALSIEKNPSLQIAIIQFLAEIQEERALIPMRKLLEEPETPDYVKAQVNNGISQII